MTETQATSAVGSSTDAADPRVDTPAASDQGAPTPSAAEERRSDPHQPVSFLPSSSERPATAEEEGAAPADDQDQELTVRTPSAPPMSSSTVPVVPVPARGTSPTTGAGKGSRSEAADQAEAAPAKSAPEPTTTDPATPRSASASRTGKSAKTSKTPTSKTGTGKTAASTAATSKEAAAAASAAKSLPASPASDGSASVRPSPTGAVRARASVASAVTGVGFRQATGATPVVSPTSRVGSVAAVGAARVTEAVRSARATVAGAATRGPRRARLHLKRIDPWSVMKFSFAVSLVLFVVAIVATSVLYLALDAMNVFESINKAFAEVTGQAGDPADAFKITAKGVIGTSVLLGAVNMVLFTALMTLGAFVYNVCADLVGGVEVTLSEKE